MRETEGEKDSDRQKEGRGGEGREGGTDGGRKGEFKNFSIHAVILLFCLFFVLSINAFISSKMYICHGFRGN